MLCAADQAGPTGTQLGSLRALMHALSRLDILPQRGLASGASWGENTANATR